MTGSLGTASSNPSEGQTPYDPHMEAVRDGEAAPSDWLAMWITLANRLVEWHQACEAEDASLVFDSHDQASLA